MSVRLFNRAVINSGKKSINLVIINKRGKLYLISNELRLGSCSTTESRKSCGDIYNCPSNSADANLINRRSRDVNLMAFSESS